MINFPLLVELQHYPSLYLPASFILGLLVGSFLNVVIYRLPKIMENEYKIECAEFFSEDIKQSSVQPEKFNLAVPASRCQSCGHKISALENIPIISYLFLKGACRACKDPISIRYPLIEFISACLTLFAIYSFGFTVSGLMACIFTWCLIALCMIDYDTYYLPDSILYPLLWLGLLLSLFGFFTTPEQSIMGAIIGYLFFWIFFHIFKWITGKEGMGYGDFKLLATLGAWMGWTHLPQIILLSTFVGAILGLSLILFFGRDNQKPIPFGPYLAIAGWISFYWGEQINQQYLQLSGLQ